jgi:lysophospholipase L1-like esterase
VYRPDLVLVSFGWNDPVTTRAADKEYAPPPSAFASLEGILVRYAFYRVARRLVAARPAAPGPGGVPRVSRDDYLANIRRFARTARGVLAAIAFLTRPHATIPETETWRGDVEPYNRTLLAFGRRSGVPVIDVRAAFAERPDAFADESHFTPRAHGEMARLLLSRLTELGLLPPRPPAPDKSVGD